MDMFGRGPRTAVALVAMALATLCSAARADEDGPPKHGVRLGLATQRISDTWREKNSYRASGVLVIGVDPAGRAAKGGITTGDVLVSVAGRTLREPSDLGYAERALQPDEPVAVVLARDNGHSIKMFEIAAVTDAGPGVSPTSTAALATPAAASTLATDAPAAAAESASSSFITDAAPFGSAPSTTAADGKVATSVEPAAAVIIARGSYEDSAAVEKGPTGAAELGVRAQPLTADLATALGAEGVEGVLVLEVTKESPADHAGLRAGDIIFKIGDQPVKDLESLDQAVIAATNPAAINMLRRGDQQMVLAPLEGHAAPGATTAAAVATPADQQQVINELQSEVATLKKELADLKEQIAKLVQESAKK